MKPAFKFSYVALLIGASACVMIAIVSNDLSDHAASLQNVSTIAMRIGSACQTEMPVIAADMVSPAQYLASRRHPMFKPGNTLLPLTRWGWQLSYETTIELAQWGYALEFGEADEANTKALDDPSTTSSKLVSLVRENPSLYKLSVLMPRSLQDSSQPPSAYLHDSSGKLIVPELWSPEAPDSLMSSMAVSATALLQKITSRAPITIVLNGGERGLNVPTQVEQWASHSPDVISAKGHLSWFEYVSRQKARQEAFLTNAAHLASGNATYIFYPTGNQYSPRSSQKWDWDYRWMRQVADYPSGSFYYGEFNDGWTAKWISQWTAGRIGKSDMLTQVLNAHGYDTSLGHPLAYHWVNDGWSINENDPALGDLELYAGFLKSTYAAGMLGGVAGYFAFPNGGFNAAFKSDRPPHWLAQIEVLAQVHAEFSYLEDILRGGDLLPGPGQSPLNSTQPAYEFPTGFANVRILVRKMRDQKRWLVSAWAADGVARSVSVQIPILGTIAVRASPVGSLYDARIVGGSRSLTMLDDACVTPTPLTIPLSTPDS